MTAGTHTAPVVVGIDIGGTKTAAALVDRDGRILARSSVPTPGRAGPQAVLGAAAGVVRTLLDRTGATARAVGVGSAGVIDPATGTVLGSTDVLDGWTGTDVRGGLSESLGAPVTVRNDVHAHALGEARYGAGAGAGSMLLLAVGTGVGAAFVHADLPGGLLLGAHAVAGHAGHVASPYASGLPCSCGARGHLEAIASGPALTAEFTRRAGTSVTDLRDVARLAADGDPHAGDVVRLGGEAVGSAVGGLVNLLDPQVVVIGGGVSNLGPDWWGPLREAAGREVLPALAGTQVLPSALGVDAALLGAAGLAWDLVAVEVA